MRIGIDIDATLTEFDKWVLINGKEDRLKIKEYAYEIRDLFGLSKEEETLFWEKHFDVLFSDVEMRRNANNVVNKLKEKGHEIFIITARSELDMSKKVNDTVLNITINWLKKHNINYNHLELACFDKRKFCKDNKIDLMIEDKPSTILEISQDIPVICMDCTYNRDITNANITRVYNWDEIDSMNI